MSISCVSRQIYMMFFKGQRLEHKILHLTLVRVRQLFIQLYLLQSNITIKMGACNTCKEVSMHCQILECTQQHQNHYCKVCQNANSDHFARNCPESIVVYHGTSSNVLTAIKKEGFIPSEAGNLGKGVYFTDDHDVAQQISQSRARQRNAKPVVFQCRIPKNPAVTKQNIHGIWENVTQKEFDEFAVVDPKRIKLLNIEQS